MLTKSAITTGWHLRHIRTRPESPIQIPTELEGLKVPAQVPGCVHTDLLDAGLIPDPFLDENEKLVAWIGHSNWRYETTVPQVRTKAERTDLVFDGLDTVATARANGQTLGRTRNMHRSYRFDVTEAESNGDVELVVDFESPYIDALAVQAELGPRTNVYPDPFNFIRKMACSFGWDWGPTLVTSGIWREARLERWNTARLASVRPTLTVHEGEGHVAISADLERTLGGSGRELKVRLRVSRSGREAVTEVLVAPDADEASVGLTISDPDLWWPHTLGEQSLYKVEVVLFDAETNDPLDEWCRMTGFRSVELDRSTDTTGTRFAFRINGKEMFLRGFNWIPGDIFPSRMTKDRYRSALEQAKEVNADMIRVWGGGLYESEDFYELCDELGLLVWQDFLFACAAYPEGEPLRSEIEAEARENVTRLMPHPSLVLWNGNNENLWLCDQDPWPERNNGADWGELFYHKMLPEIVAVVDPTRPYSAGSPWSGTWDHLPNDPNHETHHSWDVWNREDYLNYRESVPRFVSEFGWQAPPTWATLRNAISDSPIAPDSPGVIHHQKADDGNGKLVRGLAHHFPFVRGVNEWHFLTQLNQVNAIKTGVEHWRSHWPTCSGTIIWQLNDLWPATSWAAVDGQGRFKPLFHAVREMYADLLVTIQPREETLHSIVINHGEQLEGSLRTRRHSTAGQVIVEQTQSVTIPAAGVLSVSIPASVQAATDATDEFITVDFEGRRAFWYPVEDKYLDLPAADFEVSLHPLVNGADITVTAKTFVKDLLLQPDRISDTGSVDRGFTTLLPGDQVVYRLRGTGPVTVDDLEKAFVLTSLNDVLATARIESAC